MKGSYDGDRVKIFSVSAGDTKGKQAQVVVLKVRVQQQGKTSPGEDSAQRGDRLAA